MEIQDQCEEIIRLLRLSKTATPPRGDKDAGVLILLRKNALDEYEVLLCVRSMDMRKHPGEVCFPGGMRDEDDIDLQQTAIREAEEEVGLNPEHYVLLGSLPSFRARFGILIHPCVALLTKDFMPILNSAEVSEIFWLPVHRFLDPSEHSSFPIDKDYSVHSYSFPEAHTYGVTALICLTVAIGLLQKMPEFDIFPKITVDYMKSTTPDHVLDRIYGRATERFKNSKL